MRHRIFVCLAALLSGAAAVAQEPRSTPRGLLPEETSCVDCHAQLDGAALEPTGKMQEDIHYQRGLGCHDCHGGDPTLGFDGDPFAAHDEEKGFAGKPTRLQIPQFCGECHADAPFVKKFNPQARVDQLEEYVTSVHGQRNASGDERVAVCVDCHGVHGIFPVSDPRSSVYPTSLADTCARCHDNEELMGRYQVRTNQHAGYKTSVHARALYDKGDLSAPTCNDCHGSHGAVPPGVETVMNVCGTCHTREATLFREMEAKSGMDLEACIQCVICHENHAVLPPTDEMVGVGPKSTCTGCHAEGDRGYEAARQMAEEIGALRSRLTEAREILERAERAGVEVGPDQAALQEAQDALVESAVLVHSFDLPRFREAAEGGIAVAEEGVAAGHRAFGELRFRRMGLTLSLVVIGAVVLALAMTIRRIEGRA